MPNAKTRVAVLKPDSGIRSDGTDLTVDSLPRFPHSAHAHNEVHRTTPYAHYLQASLSGHSHGFPQRLSPFTQPTCK